MLTDEKKKELIEKLGVSEEEFAELVKRKSEEKNVTPGGAKLLLYYEAFNKHRGVETTLDSFSKNLDSTETLFEDASNYLSLYAATNHKNEPDWLERHLESEMKHSKNESPEEAAMLLAYAYGWREGKPLPVSSFKASSKIRPDCVSTDCLLSKINDEGKIIFLNATVNRVSNVREEEGAIRLRTTGIEITDGKDRIWVNCHDTKPFTSKKSGKLIPGKFLSTKAQMKKTELIGSIISFYNIDARISKNGDLALNTGPYSNFYFEKTKEKESPLEEN